MSSYPDAVCIATVTDDAYTPGTVVLFSSFLRHNPWFRGDLVVIQAQLSERSRAQLAQFPNVRFHSITAALDERLATLASHPAVGRKLTHLYSLEAFNLPEYDWVLALDSDLLCLGDMKGFVAVEGPLVACPDQSYFWERTRDPNTFEPTHPASGDASASTFNVGVMKITPSRLNPTVFADLVDHVRPETWDRIFTGHSDSILLNRHFRNACVQAPDRFNFLISKGLQHYTRARGLLHDAAMVHFLGRPKPWELEDISVMDAWDPVRRRAFELWRDSR